MPNIDVYNIPPELVLGKELSDYVSPEDQRRQRKEVEEILRRLRTQPGVVLADEVGMGKTFVALAVAFIITTQSRRGPVVIMVPPNLIDKWQQDLNTFCELYLRGWRAHLHRGGPLSAEDRKGTLCYGIARRGVELLRLMDDKPQDRCHLIFMAQGAMLRQQSDKWVRLALIREALRRHARGGARRLIQVKRNIHRFMAELLRAVGEERVSQWGEELWKQLLKFDPAKWKELYNDFLRNHRHRLTDDPVPKAVVKALRNRKLDVRSLAKALEQMPVRESAWVSERIREVREELKKVVQELWKRVLATARWRSPLLVMDEAHRLKNPATNLARQLQSPESKADLESGEGALARKFDRMLFLTATPFQVRHKELVNILQRFGEVRWDVDVFGDHNGFTKKLNDLENALNETQRAAIRLQKCWSRLLPEEGPQGRDPDEWWQSLQQAKRDRLTRRQGALVEVFEQAVEKCRAAEEQLRPWLIRHNKGEVWPGTEVKRRLRVEGAAIRDNGNSAEGLEVPPEQLLPFFLAARSAVSPGQDLLGEALCSSYEAFRDTRKHRKPERDELDTKQTSDERTPLQQRGDEEVRLSRAPWYLQQFDSVLQRRGGEDHPKIAATVKKAVDLWEQGEKVLIFAFYCWTCRALRVHISREIERRMAALARRRFADAGRPLEDKQVEDVLKKVRRRYFADAESPGGRVLDEELGDILDRCLANIPPKEQQQLRKRLIGVMRRFLRVKTTLVRYFPLPEYDTKEPRLAVRSMLDSKDASGVPLRFKVEQFVDFLVKRCSKVDRNEYLDVVDKMNTGAMRVTTNDEQLEDTSTSGLVRTLANVRGATGKTSREQRTRLMRAFNTPFLPDIFVCSQVMGEGVDLQRYCCHVIHHDLDWNPSNIEQRTGRIDRLACRAELRRHPIHVYLPYLSGAADERQFRVMTEREQWFRIVMGQEEVARLIPRDTDEDRPRLPRTLREKVTFDLGINQSADGRCASSRGQTSSDRAADQAMDEP